MPASHVACATKRCTPLKRVISPPPTPKMQEAAHYSREAHLVQTQLIEADEGEGKTKMTLVMVHAQDHLMTSILAKELIAELIAIYRAQPLHA